MKKIVVAIFFLLVFATVIYPIPNPVAESSHTSYTVLWIVSDTHLESTDGTRPTQAQWSSACGDAIDLGVDIAFLNGDLIDFPEDPCIECLGDTPQSVIDAGLCCGTVEKTEDWYDYVFNNSGQTYSWSDIESFASLTDVVVGNHDPNWTNNMGLDELYTTYTYGNILFIKLGTEAVNSSYDNYNWNLHLNGGNWHMKTQEDWVNSTIQNNSDMNIIIISHAGVDNTTQITSSGMQSLHPLANWTGLCQYIYNHPEYHIDLWVSAHKHLNHATNDCIVEKWNCTFIDDSAFDCSGKTTEDSTFFYFTNGSKTVTAKSYEHYANSGALYVGAFQTRGEFPYSFDLTYAFNENYTASSSDGWVSINNETNGSILENNTRYYNATTIADSYYYNIQIANDAAFSDIFANILYINESAKGDLVYNEYTNYWTFNDINTIQEYGGSTGNHYYRYRTRYRRVTE